MDSPSPSDRILRTITLISFVAALALLIPYGVVSRSAIPTIGLVPMFLSSVLGLLSLSIDFRWRRLPFYIDVFLAMFLFSILVPYWVLGARTSSARSVIMLGTYGTVPLMLNLCIHSFFVFRDVFSAFSLAHTCPHCHADIRTRALFGITRVQVEKPRHSCSSDEVYQPLEAAKYDDDERESSEIDTLFRPSMETLTSTNSSLKLV